MPEMHATEEELILHYYGETPADARVETHLAQCAHCRQGLDELRHVLSLVDAQHLPEPLEGLEQRVWTRIQPEIAGGKTGWFSRSFLGRGDLGGARWVFAGGAVAALVVAAFVAGRVSKPDVASPAAVPQVATTRTGTDAAGRLMNVAVGDHLDESQMVLLELLNGNTSDPRSIEDEQVRARELVADNRLYRHTAVRVGDEGMREVLDALERVLLEIANAPPDVSARELEALRADIEQRGILFRVRVVASEMRAREQQDVTGTRVGP
jgi:hypothetical protein